MHRRAAAAHRHGRVTIDVVGGAGMVIERDCMSCPGQEPSGKRRSKRCANRMRCLHCWGNAPVAIVDFFAEMVRENPQMRYWLSGAFVPLQDPGRLPSGIADSARRLPSLYVGRLVAGHGSQTMGRSGNMRCVRPWALMVPMGLAAMLAGCPPTDRQRYATRLEYTGRPALHGLHSARLREVMDELNRLMFEDLPQEMDVEARRERRLDEVHQLALKLAETADDISDVLEDVKIDAESRQVFVAYAEKLEEEAHELAGLSLGKDIRLIDAKVDEMITTCNACHSSFRILPRIEAAGEPPF